MLGSPSPHSPPIKGGEIRKEPPIEGGGKEEAPINGREIEKDPISREEEIGERLSIKGKEWNAFRESPEVGRNFKAIISEKLI